MDLLNRFSFRHAIDLLRVLVSRDLKIRYKRSFLGLAWSLLNPLLQLLVFRSVFQFLLPLNIASYTLFLFSGILVWTWFQRLLDGRHQLHRGECRPDPPAGLSGGRAAAGDHLLEPVPFRAGASGAAGGIAA